MYPISSPASPVGSVRRAAQILPSVVIFSLLLGVLLWGHLTSWSLPSFSRLTSADGKDDWCSAHNVPDSICVECNPDLLPPSKSPGWCEVHGVHECPLCHPERAQTTTPVAVSEEDRQRVQRALAFTERGANNRDCKLHQRRIQFATIESVEKVGIEVAPVWTAPVVEAVTAPGEISYDPTRTARLSPRVPGTVFQAFKKVGDAVSSGEVLALVEAAEVGKAKAEFLQALIQLRSRSTNFDLLREGNASGSIPERTLRETETLLSEARIRLATARQALVNLGLPLEPAFLKDIPDARLADQLQFLGIPASLAKSLPRGTTGNLLPLVAPADGIVVAREAVAGEVVETNRVLFTVVDLHEMWLTLDVRLEEISSITPGQQVIFQPDGGKEQSTGTVAWLSSEADHKTRTVKIRATLPNPAGKLRANTFGMGKVILRQEPRAIVVPSGAVHWEGDCHIVFVRDKHFLQSDAPKVFHTRTVRLGARDEKQTEIIAGVLPGELVAVKGSASLRGELLRGNLGEG